MQLTSEDAHTMKIYQRSVTGSGIKNKTSNLYSSDSASFSGLSIVLTMDVSCGAVCVCKGSSSKTKCLYQIIENSQNSKAVLVSFRKRKTGFNSFH